MSAAAPVALPASVGMPGRPLCSHRPAPRASPIPGASPSPAIARYCRRPRQPGRCSLARGRRPRRAPPRPGAAHPCAIAQAQCADRSRLILPAPRLQSCPRRLRSRRPPQPACRAAPLQPRRCSLARGRRPRRAPPRPGAVPSLRAPAHRKNIVARQRTTCYNRVCFRAGCNSPPAVTVREPQPMPAAAEPVKFRYRRYSPDGRGVLLRVRAPRRPIPGGGAFCWAFPRRDAGQADPPTGSGQRKGPSPPGDFPQALPPVPRAFLRGERQKGRQARPVQTDLRKEA